MAIFVVLLLLVLAALLAVSIMTSIQRRQQQRRLQQRRLRLEVEELNEIVTCLELTLPNPLIAKHLNDKVIALLEKIESLEDYNRERIRSQVAAAQTRSERLASPMESRVISFQRDSDAQILKAQSHITDAINYLPHLVAIGKVSELELDSFQNELRWAHLMIAVISNIAQGRKSLAISDRFTAHAFFRKAQQLLMESLHADPRRLRLIKELSELIDGSRPEISREFLEPQSKRLTALAG